MGKGRWPTWEEARRRREKAIALRKQGLSYRQIQALVGGSSSSLSLWLREVPLTDLQKTGLRRRKQDAIERTARKLHENRLARQAEIRAEAVEQIGTVSERDLFVAGVVAYAAEGLKNKPWSGSRPVQFINSDPQMITLFLHWLDLIGIKRESMSFRLAIHCNADVEGALAFWSDLVGAPGKDFLSTTLKRHNPKTRRRSVGPTYRGCLTVTVRRSTDLNRRIDGWFRAIVQHLNEGRQRHEEGTSPSYALRYWFRSGVV
jgi:hypothetical protein